MSRIVLLGALLALATAMPAAADCLAVVTQLEERIVTLDGQQQTVEVKTRTGPVTVEQETDGAGPTESWGGASSGLAGAREKLRNARLSHQSGDQDGCLVLVEEARMIIQGLSP